MQVATDIESAPLLGRSVTLSDEPSATPPKRGLFGGSKKEVQAEPLPRTSTAPSPPTAPSDAGSGSIMKYGESHHEHEDAVSVYHEHDEEDVGGGGHRLH